MNTTIVLSIAACWIASNAAFVILMINRNKLKPHVAPVLTDDQEAEREQQAEKAKQIQAHFQRLMDYDVDKALERKYEGG
jgi:hypothetical protein